MAHPDTDCDLSLYGIGPEPDLPSAEELAERRKRRDGNDERIAELEERLAEVEAQLAAERRIRPGFWPKAA